MSSEPPGTLTSDVDSTDKKSVIIQPVNSSTPISSEMKDNNSNNRFNLRTLILGAIVAQNAIYTLARYSISSDLCIYE